MTELTEDYNALSAKIIDCAYKVHSTLGPGLLESVYESCLLHELRKGGIRALSQVEVPIIYDGLPLQNSFKIDIFVEDKIILELKAVEKCLPLYRAQLQTYMKLKRCKLGLLINFNTRVIKNGIERIILSQ